MLNVSLHRRKGIKFIRSIEPIKVIKCDKCIEFIKCIELNDFVELIKLNHNNDEISKLIKSTRAVIEPCTEYCFQRGRSSIWEKN